MAGAWMPDTFLAELESLLPPEVPWSDEGGRPRVPHRAVVAVLWYLLVSILLSPAEAEAWFDDSI